MIYEFQVENSLLAPIVLFVELQKYKSQLVHRGKIVAVPVSVDKRRVLTTTLTNVSNATIVRGNNYNRPIYRGELKAGLVQEAFKYLESTNNSYFGHGDQEDASFQAANIAGNDDLDHLPDRAYAPAAEGHTTKLLDLSRPYSQTMPVFFPNCTGDADDPDRIPKVSEAEWLVHMLRCVRKNLSEFPLFVFTGAYRLDAQRTRSAYNALVGYTRFGDGQIRKSVAAEDRFLGQTLRGSGDYYAKLEMDLSAKCREFGYPQLFFTFSNSDSWDINLSTALSQDGHDVWHKKDEVMRLTLLGEAEEPVMITDNYVVHISETNTLLRSWKCPYHHECQRVPMSKLLPPNERKELLARNQYSMQRIFDHRARSLINNILLAENNGLGVKVYHSIKEFGDFSGWAHVHGVGWRHHSDSTDSVFKKLHNGLPINESDMHHLIHLADSILTVRLSALQLSTDFPELSAQRAEEIVELAATHQIHDCSVGKCEIVNDSDGCLYHFPRLPSDHTIIVSPPHFGIDAEEAKYLVDQSMAVKKAVREVLTELGETGQLDGVNLIDVLLRSLGDIDGMEPTPEGCYIWLHGIFPPSLTLNDWLQRIRNNQDTHVALLAVYYTALSTSTWHVEKSLVNQLVLRREVAESYVTDYNPFCLEAMRSNMELSLVLHTPKKCIEYMTKAQKHPSSHRNVVNRLKEMGEAASLENILKRMSDLREVSLSEAFFRIDDSLSLSETNAQVVFVNTNFPENRSRNYIRVPEGGIMLPDRVGQYITAPDFLDNYCDK